MLKISERHIVLRKIIIIKRDLQTFTQPRQMGKYPQIDVMQIVCAQQDVCKTVFSDLNIYMNTTPTSYKHSEE